MKDRFIVIREPSSAGSAGCGLTLHVRDWAGNSASGNRVPFVLVHGLSSNARTWDGVARVLSEAGHRVVAVDQRGHGLSDKPDDGYDFDTVTEDLILLLEKMSLKQPIVVGQSWGGNVMLALGAKHPAQVRGVGFVDGGTIDLQMNQGATWESMSKRLTPPPLTGTPRENMVERMRMFHPDWSEEGIDGTLANFETLADGTVRPWLALERHMKILRAMWEQRPAELYPQVTVPVLICPAHDPRNGARLAHKEKEVAAAERGLPNSVVHWFRDTVHDIHVQRPAALAEVLHHHAVEGIWA